MNSGSGGALSLLTSVLLTSAGLGLLLNLLAVFLREVPASVSNPLSFYRFLLSNNGWRDGGKDIRRLDEG